MKSPGEVKRESAGSLGALRESDSQHPRSLDNLIARAGKLMYAQKGKGVENR